MLLRIERLTYSRSSKRGLKAKENVSVRISDIFFINVPLFTIKEHEMEIHAILMNTQNIIFWETDLDKSNRLLSGSQFVNSLYCIVLYCIVLYCIVLYCIVLQGFRNF